MRAKHGETIDLTIGPSVELDPVRHFHSYPRVPPWICRRSRAKKRGIDDCRGWQLKRDYQPPKELMPRLAVLVAAIDKLEEAAD
jgi:hypothetical protein